MLAAAYKVLKSMPSRFKAWSLPVGAAGAYLTHSAFKNDPVYTTTNDERVPYLTEFVEKQGSLMNTINALGLDYNIKRNNKSTLEKVASRITNTQSLYPFIKKIASFGLYYPQLTLDCIMTEQDKLATDGIVEAPINFDKMAAIIGTIVWDI